MTFQALTIAGSDSGGGAGIQADLKTFQQRRVFGTSVITAITAQNTQGVYDIHFPPVQSIEQQVKAVTNDFNISTFKIGMLGNSEIIETVSHCIDKARLGVCVVDPVMVSKGGAPLLLNDAIESLKKNILPLADIVTPNIPEAEKLSDIKISDELSILKAAEKIMSYGAKAVVIKGGHGEGGKSQHCCDYVFLEKEQFILSRPRIITKQTHGTGCTFSACLTAEIAKGKSIKSSIEIAKAFITAAVSDSLNIGSGHGPTNHWAYRDE